MEQEQLEREVPTDTSERKSVRVRRDLAFAEVISYNKANLERVEQNESRQQERTKTNFI